jgi:hypothetical protein
MRRVTAIEVASRRQPSLIRRAALPSGRVTVSLSPRTPSLTFTEDDEIDEERIAKRIRVHLHLLELGDRPRFVLAEEFVPRRQMSEIELRCRYREEPNETTE